MMRPLIFFISITLGLIYSFDSSAQDSHLEDFIISVELDENMIQLHCAKGCNWTQLSFNNPGPSAPQAIGPNGMISNSELNKKEASTYYFKIYEDRNMIYLEGTQGTSFIENSFSLYEGQVQWIDQNGMRRSKDEQ